MAASVPCQQHHPCNGDGANKKPGEVYYVYQSMISDGSVLTIKHALRTVDGLSFGARREPRLLVSIASDEVTLRYSWVSDYIWSL